MAHLGLVTDEQSTGKVYTPQAYQYSFESESFKDKYERLNKPPPER
jgi:hypothetical protein